MKGSFPLQSSTCSASATAGLLLCVSLCGVVFVIGQFSCVLCFFQPFSSFCSGELPLLSSPSRGRVPDCSCVGVLEQIKFVADARVCSFVFFVFLNNFFFAQIFLFFRLLLALYSTDQQKNSCRPSFLSCLLRSLIDAAAASSRLCFFSLFWGGEGGFLGARVLSVARQVCTYISALLGDTSCVPPLLYPSFPLLCTCTTGLFLHFAVSVVVVAVTSRDGNCSFLLYCASGFTFMQETTKEAEQGL